MFTLPHALNALAQGNPRVIYAILFKSASETLVEFGENPRCLGGEIAATLVLHTWGQTLEQHLHLHCLVAAGALHADGHWIGSRRGFLFPVHALSHVCRGKFTAALARAFASNQLQFAGTTEPLAQLHAQQRFIAQLRSTPWVVYTKHPFASPEHVLDYLGRYTHRIAISNNRLLSIDDSAVRFRYKDYAHGNRGKAMCLDAQEFLRRFLLHVLPSGFMRIRHYGLLANRTKRAMLASAREALSAPPPVQAPVPESVQAFWLRIAQRDIHLCVRCGTGRMITIGTIAPSHTAMPYPVRAPPCAT